MERLKSITIIFLLAVGLLASAASAKPASVLLQEGLYAEEIEGDLDAAIKIYGQVITQAKETQRVAAQATYRIGMCFLKKGQKDSAAEYFQKVVSNFPEKKSLVTKARRQLAKLEPIGGLGSVELVSVSQLIKSGKVPAFKTQIYDNTGLDLETGVTAPLKDDWPALFDVAWDNDGGGALMINPKSSVRFLALGAAEKWGDAISMARNTLAVLRTSTARGMFARQSKFVAVLTNEGNLAVIQIGEYDESQATLYGWVEKIPAGVRCFGPVMERVINDDGEEKHCLIDFDTGRLFSHSTEISSEEAFLRWIAENRIDAMGETRTSGPGLYGFDMAAIPIAAETWGTISPKGLADDLSIAKGGTPALMSAVGNLPVTYIFKTREGGMGIVQILEMQDNKKPRHFRIRYKMLQEPAKIAPVEVFGPVKVVGLYDIDHPTTTEKECAIDFDTGKLSKIPPQARRMPGDDLMKWLSGKGIDAVAEIASKDRGLIGVYVAVKTMPPYVWDKISPTELRALMVKNYSARQETTPMLLEDEYQQVFAFITRDSGLGILQILDVDKSTQKVKFRYKMLEDVRRPGAKIEYELQQLAESAGKLKQLGLAVAMFADDHNSKLPDTLQELEPYVGKKQDFKWILDNVEYLGKGKKVAGSLNFVTAYDKTLLEGGNGTNVLFGDSHVEFVVPKRLKELGITPKTSRAKL